MHHFTSWMAGIGARPYRWLALLGALGVLAYSGTTSNAASVVAISGDLGFFTYGNYPAPLDNGSFSGTVTFATLPVTGETVTSATADVRFYNAIHQLLFTVGGSGSYDTSVAGATQYTSLTVSGGTHVGTTPVSVASLVLSFSSWPLGTNKGTVQPYAAPGYSSVEYTYGTGVDAITYYDPVISGTASVPEPSTLTLGLFGMVSGLLYTWVNRGKPRS